MRSNGLATILLMIPVLAIPAMAIFGIPQFATVQDAIFGDLQDTKNESRGRSWAKRSNDAVFDEFEGFESETDTEEGDEPSPKQVEPTPKKQSPRNTKPKKKNDATSVAWENDWFSEPSGGKSTKANSSQPSRDFEGEEPESKKTVILDKSVKGQKRQIPSAQSDVAVRSAAVESAEAIPQAVVQAGFDDSSEQFKPKPPVKGKRVQSSEQRPPKAREQVDGQLTWKIAIERLHELDIRNYRIEPGRGGEQFVFICHAPTDTTGVSIRFEAEAEDPLKALEKVLEQIVERRQKQQ